MYKMAYFSAFHSSGGKLTTAYWCLFANKRFIHNRTKGKDFQEVDYIFLICNIPLVLLEFLPVPCPVQAACKAQLGSQDCNCLKQNDCVCLGSCFFFFCQCLPYRRIQNICIFSCSAAFSVFWITYVFCLFLLFNTGITCETPPTSTAFMSTVLSNGRPPTAHLLCQNALSAFRLLMKWLPMAFFCNWTPGSRAACYHGDHFLKNTGKEEACQWCNVQEHRETAGERNFTISVLHKDKPVINYRCRSRYIFTPVEANEHVWLESSGMFLIVTSVKWGLIFLLWSPRQVLYRWDSSNGSLEKSVWGHLSTGVEFLFIFDEKSKACSLNFEFWILPCVFTHSSVQFLNDIKLVSRNLPKNLVH